MPLPLADRIDLHRRALARLSRYPLDSVAWYPWHHDGCGCRHCAAARVRALRAHHGRMLSQLEAALFRSICSEDLKREALRVDHTDRVALRGHR